MRGKDYNQGNLSAYDGDLGCMKDKMRQIIQEQGLSYVIIMLSYFILFHFYLFC